jgi:uncharacterized protein (DUF1697 family)
VAGKQKKFTGGFTHVALLRAVNVGGKNRLPMSDLVSICTDAGCANVQTYIASGNVLFNASDACAKRMPELVQRAIEKRFGFSSPVIVRTARQMQEIVEANPFKDDLERVYVAFLQSKPTEAQVAALDPNRSPGDAYVLTGSEIYLNLAKNGAATTKLTTTYFDSKLNTVTTMRNWRTTSALLELMKPSK